MTSRVKPWHREDSRARVGLLLALALASLIGLAAPALAANTYYVAYDSTDTSSARNCATIQSSGTPGYTIRQGLKCLTPGDTLIIKSGTYTGFNNRLDSQDYKTSGVAEMVTGTNATTGAITVTTNDGGRFTIRVPGNNACIRFANPGLSYWHISNFYCDMSAQTNGTDENGENGIYLTGGSSFNDIGNFEAAYGYGNGVGFNNNGGNSDSNRIHDCHVHHFNDLNGPGNSGVMRPNGAYGFYYDSGSNIIENCEIDHNGGYGIHLYNFTPSGGNNVIRNNFVHHNGVAGLSAGSNFGILISQGVGDQVYGNVVYANNGGIQVYSAETNALVANNTVVGNSAIAGIEIQTFTGSGNVVRNNVLYNNANGCGSAQLSDCDRVLYSLASSTLDHNVSTTSDPGFNNAAASPPDYSLTSSATTLIDQGSSTGVSGIVTTDILSVSRPQNSVYDIGAYERSTGTVAVTITTTVLGAGQRTAAYLDYAYITGGTGTYTSCTVTAGTLPTGLSTSIVSNACQFSGTPSVANTFTFTIQVCDSAASCDTQAFTVTITDIDPTCSTVVSGSWTLDHCPGASSSNSTADAATTGVDTSLDDFAVCVIGADSTATFPTMQDSVGGMSNSWTQFGGTQTAMYGKVKAYYARLTNHGTGHTFTAATGGATSYPAIQCAVFRGSKASPFDVASAGTAVFDDVIMRPGVITLAQTKELVVLAAQTESVDTLVASDSYVIYQRAIQSGKAFGVALAWQTYAVGASPNAAFSWDAPMDAAAVSGSFLASDSTVMAQPSRRLRLRLPHAR